MALIIYPDSGYDSYISEADAVVEAGKYLIGQTFLALTPEEQELYLRQGFRTIQNLEGFRGPTPPAASGCLPSAQLQIVMQDAYFGITLNKPTAQVASQSAGPVSIAYFEGAPVAPDVIPLTARTCLQEYGAIITDASGGGVIGTVRKAR